MILLENRGVLKITGDDARSFLQGLITNDINKLTESSAVYAAMLTPQGKLMFEFILHQIDEDIYIDCSNAILGELVKKLNFYKLRSKVKIEDISNRCRVYSDGVFGIDDPRNKNMGKRLILDATPEITGSLNDYNLLRINNVVPEGDDFVPDRTYILQANFEDLHGVDFEKGCYVGQEVTARTKYKGNISKKFYKVTSDAALPERGEKIRSGTTEVGELRFAIGNSGLAVLDIESAQSDASFMCGNIPIQVARS